jgi:hypothetical protein
MATDLLYVMGFSNIINYISRQCCLYCGSERNSTVRRANGNEIIIIINQNSEEEEEGKERDDK